jgi:hypothetical protein
VKTMIILISLELLFPVICHPAAVVPPLHIDDDGPLMDAKSLELDELWRVGGEDEDVIFGRITDVIRHPNGDIYVLDNQVCQVVVISDEGEHLRDLSRQGDGPGEIRQPTGIVLLPDDMLGIGVGFPGKMVVLKLDGTPVTTQYPIGDPAEGNVGVLISLRYAGGVLVASGGRIVFEEQGNSHSLRFLSVSEPGLDGFTRILEKNTPFDPTGRRFVEIDNYYIDGSWALGPEGNIFAPMERNAYEISVFDKTGELQYVFGRRYEPRMRTRDDKDAVSPLINPGGDPGNRDWDIDDHDQCVSRIMINPDDHTVWVLTPHGSNDQPEVILETWDVFGVEGQYLQQVSIPLGHEMNDGTCYLVGGNRLVVVKGTGSAFNNDGGPDEGEEESEVEPLEVICYEMK